MAARRPRPSAGSPDEGLSSPPCPSCAAGSTPTPRRPGPITTRCAALVADLRARQDVVAGRGAGGDEPSIERHRERGKLPVRERIERLLDPGSAFLELSPLAATGLYDDEAPGAGIVTGRRPHRRHDLRRRRQRRDRQGRHLLPDDGQEAPARAGDRAREPPAVPVPRRFRRRVPAAAGRRLPRSRPLRAHLLQPGPHVGGRHPAGGAGHGLVHGRWRLRAGDERRDRHRQGHRHDLPRRPAAGEGGDRRGRHARGTRRLRRPHPALGGRRPRGARRRARARARPVDHREPQPQGPAAPLGSRCARATGGRPGRASMVPSRSTRAGRSRSARSSPASSTGRGSTSSSRATARRS